jgi:thiol reductant ABC exporter CydD subunit
MHMDRKLLGWARVGGWLLGAAALAGYGSGLLAIAQAWLLSSVVAGVFLGGQGLTEAMPGLLGLLIVFLARAGLAWANETSGAAGAVRIKNELRQRLLSRLYQQGPVLNGNQPTGELVTTVVQSVEALDGFYSQYLPQVILAVLVPLSVLVVVFPLDLLSGLVFLLTGPLIPVFMILIGRSAEAVTRKQYTVLGRMSAFFLDTLQGLATLKTLNQSEARIERIAEVSERYRQKTMEVLRLTFLSALALELSATISTAVVAVEVGLRLLYGQMEFQPAFFILILAPEFYLPLRLLGQRFHAGAAGAAGAKRIVAVLGGEEKSTIETQRTQRNEENFTTAPQGCSKPETRRVGDTVGARGEDKDGSSETSLCAPTAAEAPSLLVLENVTFRYPGRTEPALEHVSIELKRGELAALVGVSGAGKSTLAAMLLGFIQPQSGLIRLNGEVIGSLDTPEWRRLIAWVPQQPAIFQDTLAENIRLSKPDASLEEVRRAAQLAGLDGFILGLPQGYETKAGAGGARLSGGQAQRLALARAFLKDAPILILDEPTSRLDPQLEDEIAETTRRLCQGRMALVIAHRLASIRQAQRVIVIDSGRIVEQGAPAALQAQAGHFARLVERAQ